MAYNPSSLFRSLATMPPSDTLLPSTPLLSMLPTTFLTLLLLTTTVSTLTSRLLVRLPGTPRALTLLLLKLVPSSNWILLPSLRPRSPTTVSLVSVTLNLSALVSRPLSVLPLTLPSSTRTLTSSASLSPLKTRLVLNNCQKSYIFC
jgi:hypothetical protein